MCIFNALTKSIIYIVPQETTALQLDIFNKRKQQINENNVAKEGLNLKWRRQKMKSTYFASNQWLAKNRLFSLQYDIENFIFTSSYHIRKFHIYSKIRIYGKMLLSYIFVWRKARKIDISVKRKHMKTNENMIFSALFTNFRKTKILFFMQCYYLVFLSNRF